MPDNGNGNGLRRWLDKILIGAVALVIAFAGAFYSIQASNAAATRDRVETLERKYERMDEKLDTIGRDVKDIKIEMKEMKP